MSLSFTNFYQRFIQGFSRIAALFITLLKITKLSKLALKAFKANENKMIKIDNKLNKTIINLFRNLTYMLNIGAIEELIFLILYIKKVLNYLR